MGAILPKPVESASVEQHAGKSFRVGVAEVNGWRNGMEDAHLIHMCTDWAFFGVFDGHGGDQCSHFVAEKIHTELRTHGCPQDDAAFKQLVLRADKVFLDTGQDSGSTGTMCIVHRPTHGNKFRLRIANVGDSRVLLGHRDGTIVNGGGTDRGLTTDHKPDHPSERERIYRCGGFVEVTQAGGPARVNGELSVSRCFGDASHKRTGGPRPEDHPVTADPELGHAECSESDFLLLVCDGISEGDFPNAAVVKMAASSLKENNDPSAAAKAICFKAIEAGSRDNVTCMMVLLTGTGSDNVQKHAEFIPGPLITATLENKAFMTAYEGMAKRSGLTLAQAVEMRYETVVEMLAGRGIIRVQAIELQNEVNAIGTPSGTKGSAARSAWFRNWEERLPERFASDESENDMIRSLMAQRGLGSGGSVGLPTGKGSAPLRRIRVPEVKVLQRAVAENPALDWDPRMSDVAGTEGEVIQDDPSDDTSQIFFPASNVTAWMPTSALMNCDTGVSKGQGRGHATVGARRGHLPPTPPRLDQSLPLVADSAARRALPRPDVSAPGGASLSSSGSFRMSGVGFPGAPRLPVMSATGSTPPGSVAASPAAGRFRGPSAVDSATGNRAPRAVSVGVGGRTTSQIGFRTPSPGGSAKGAPPGRQSRSMPPHFRQQ